MRRLAASLTAVCVFSLTLCGCGGSQTKPRLWLGHAERASATRCASSACGLHTITLTWDAFRWGRATTGYYVFLNGTRMGAPTSTHWTFTSIDCGTTATLGVQAHDSSGRTSEKYATRYIPPKCPGPTVHYYVAEAAAGTHDGSSCANAEAVATLSSKDEWTPGNVIGLCGTITSAITAEGSGTSSDPITVYWEPGASLQEPVCPGAGDGATGCFDTNGQTDLTLDGGANGSVESTANGTGLAHHNPNATGIYAENCTGCIIENLTIAGMYREAPGSDDCTAQNAVGVWYSGSNTALKNNTFRWDQVGANLDNISAGQSHMVVAGNTFNDSGTAMNWISNTGGSASTGPILFYDNTVASMSPWDTGDSDCYHEDGIHCWTSAGQTPLNFSNGIYIYDNRWSGIGVDATAYIYMEANPGGPTCAASSSPIYVFNNVMTASVPVTNGRALEEVTSGEPREYNNTIVGADTGGGTCEMLNGAATNAITENNVYATCNVAMYATALPTWRAGQPNHNVWEDGGGNEWKCGSHFYSEVQFSSWQSCAQSAGGGGATAETDSAYYRASDLNTDGSPQAGSNVLGAGANLTSLCTGYLAQLCSDIKGTARPSSGAWNAGAF